MICNILLGHSFFASGHNLTFFEKYLPLKVRPIVFLKIYFGMVLCNMQVIREGRVVKGLKNWVEFGSCLMSFMDSP